MSKETPMMKQYRAVKEKHPEALLFFRMGDFYEMFCEDAEIASKELNLVLTSKSAGIDGKIPMCGVPHHAVESYVSKLIAAGHRVAICEQLEDPRKAKGIVKRDIVRIISPGTVLEESMFSDGQNNFLAALFQENNYWGLCYADISTGDFKVTDILSDKTNSYSSVYDEIYRVNPKEVLLPEMLYQDNPFINDFKKVYSGLITPVYGDFKDQNLCESIIRKQFKLTDNSGLFLTNAEKSAAAIIIDFLNKTQFRTLDYIQKVSVYNKSRYMTIDSNTRRNLELTSTIVSNEKKGSLLWVLDKTETYMGKRLLREWVENPLLDIDEIKKRQNSVTELYQNPIQLNDLRHILKGILDLDRISGRIVYGNSNPRDLIALKDSIRLLPQLQNVLIKFHGDVFSDINNHFDILEDISQLIEKAIDDDAPVNLKDGGVVRKGYNNEIDELKEIAAGSHSFILNLEKKEREKTGIKNLKIKYNRVFGYSIEVSNSFKDKVPDYYIRRQTLVNGERYYTGELKEYEEKILNATEQIIDLESEVYSNVKDYISENSSRIQLVSSFISLIDVFQSLAYCALENRYCCPIIKDNGVINIKNGRHPMVEKVCEDSFICNDTQIDTGEHKIMLITGPNMAGKSTYMRQVALIVLLAQMGSYIPADYAEIGIADRVFTRIGASDDLVGGNSTFMVEMRETAYILNNATKNSLVILDEIGRGTSTFDGLSLAWACIEYLSSSLNSPKTLFATHYHELTVLEGELNNLKNYSISVDEVNGNLIFLRKISPGKADKSYGIQVARLAGIPVHIINKAKKVLTQLEKNKLNGLSCNFENEKLSLFREITPEEDEVLESVLKLDINTLRPIDALKLLEEWQDYLRNE